MCRWQRTARRKRSARRNWRSSAGGEQADLDQLGDARAADRIFADPVQRLQVAQAALAVLDVGLDDVAAVAHPLVARVALGELLLDELATVPATTSFQKRACDLVVERLVAPDVARLEDRGADRLVGLGHPDHLVDARGSNGRP